MCCYLNNVLFSGGSREARPASNTRAEGEGQTDLASVCVWGACLLDECSTWVLSTGLSMCHQGLPGPSGPAGEKVRLIQLSVISGSIRMWFHHMVHNLMQWLSKMNKPVNLSVPRETTAHEGSLAEVWVMRYEKSPHIINELSFFLNVHLMSLLVTSHYCVFHAAARFTGQERGTGQLSNSLLYEHCRSPECLISLAVVPQGDQGPSGAEGLRGQKGEPGQRGEKVSNISPKYTIVYLGLFMWPVLLYHL